MPVEAPNAAMGVGRALRLEQARGPSTAARTNLGSCRSGNCTFRWQHPNLGCCHLGKCPWEVAACELPLVKYLTSFFKCRH